MEINNGSLMQLFGNSSQMAQIRDSNSTHQYIIFPDNISVVYEMYYFVNSTLTIPRNSDKILPEYLVLDLFNLDTSIDNIYNYARNVTLVCNIGIQVIEIPLSLLWNLNMPEIIGHKLYLEIQFEMFFGKINLYRLNNNTVNFHIKNMSNMVNYVSNFSLIYKSYTYGNRDRLYDMSYNIIQQISSIELNVSLDDLNDESREFVINTEHFEGFTKGFFIESQNISDLSEIQIFINGHVRTNYDSFLIRNRCLKISENMLYYSFNNDMSYQERNYNSFDGSICLGQFTSTKLRINFLTPRNKVKIYGLTMNDFRQLHGQSSLIHNIDNFHTVQDFNSHPLLSYNELISSPLQYSALNIYSINNNNIIPNDIIPNIINNINNINYNINNINQYVDNTIDYFGYTGSTGPSGSTGSTGPTGSSGSTGPSNSYYTVGYYVNDNSGNYTNELPIGDTLNRVISQDKKICGICWDEIQENDMYMYCSCCNNNFKEEEIKHWLQQRRTCPTCRGSWSNFNLYINSN